MPSSPSSSAQAARLAVAARLRELMLDAGLRGGELAARCGWSGAKSSRIINAKTSPSDADIRAWCAACGAEDQAADLIAKNRAADSMYLEWRRMERTGLRQAQESVRPLYERTRAFRAYASWLVPGIVQTRAYTTAILAGIRDRRGLADDVERAADERMDRQHILYQGHHRFALLIEESVLRSGIGGRGVMLEQLRHLLVVGRLPNVSLGVVPMRPDRDKAWPVEGFWIYDQAQVSVELVSGYLTITQPSEIAMYADVFTELSTFAVHGALARALITGAMDALG
ncbi:helix-turn-helix domain-containing protein [Streptacidiphilus sp. PB12-B1b]|uniref:helix-turn-helix domain-containing protein n=1 Tax=Streptacidiphilus sp. PB12-B1b TaxID=2705012 RepID=UPI0015FC8543|nr:helix-turn-helix transcriptional regulator [Streptacidiphilus sp. PB12-B1b]QMU78115.1 helix-turn-helix domain-containing protein [Streptacidiphilus sp. PB12-B1b]